MLESRGRGSNKKNLNMIMHLFIMHKTNKQRFKLTSNDELLYYMLGQVNQERAWDLPQALCATNRCHWQREREPKILRY